MTRKERFMKGLKKSSIIVLALAFASSVLLIVFLEKQMDDGLIAKIFTESQYLMNSTDQVGHVSYVLTEYKETPPEKYTLYFMGGSSSRTIYYSDSYVEQEIKETYGVDVNAEVLFTNAQTYLDALLLIENIPNNSGAVILSSVAIKLEEPYGLSYGMTMKTMPLKGEVFYSVVNEYYDEEGMQLYSLKSGHFLRELLDKIFIGPKSFFENPTYIVGADVDETAPIRELPDALLQTKLEAGREDLNNIDQQDIDDFYEIIDLLARICAEKNLELILIDLPYDEEMIGEIRFNDIIMADLFSEINQIASEKYDNVTYLSYVHDIDIVHDDFIDIKHVGAYEDRRAYIDGLVENIGFLFE